MRNSNSKDVKNVFDGKFKTIDKSKTSPDRAQTCDWIELALRFQFGKKGETRNLILSIFTHLSKRIQFFSSYLYFE